MGLDMGMLLFAPNNLICFLKWQKPTNLCFLLKQDKNGQKKLFLKKTKNMCMSLCQGGDILDISEDIEGGD